MRLVLAVLTLGFPFFAADDPWTKVQELKSGTEVRITKTNAKTPVIAKFDEATAERIVVVVKNEQVSIPKEEIERIDFRPERPRTVRETKSSQGPQETRPQPPGSTPGPNVSSSSGVTFQGKADFEPLYRRRPGAPKQ